MSGIVAQNINRHSGLIKAPEAGGGAWTFIKKLTASSSADLSFVNGASDVVLDSTYAEYIFYFVNIHPQTENAVFEYNFTTDGSNWNVTKTTVAWRAFQNENGSGGVLDYQGAKDLAQGTGFQPITWDVENDNDASTSGELFVFSPASTTFVKHFMHRSNGMHSNPACFTNFTTGYCNTTSAVTGVQFKMSSGNIDAGDIFLHGLTT
jgi:hypothetical protein